MFQDKKINIVYLFPGPIYRPDLPNFKDRFEMLSENFEGEIYSWSCDPKYREYEISSFVFRGLVDRSRGLVKKLNLVCHVISNALRHHKKKKVDCIVCYEPMFTGIIGAILKFIFRCPLIVEINSEHYAGAINAFYGDGFFSCIKSAIFKILANISLLCADGIKVLTPGIEKKLPIRFKDKKFFIFHDFVPTHIFDQSFDSPDKVILFVGYPFELKGIGSLIKAFQHISKDYPDFRLLLIGHRLKEEAIKKFGCLPASITFMPGLSYDVLMEYFKKCYCFILPSLTEGMGRVLLEAMACGKPVIGTRVGGIPDLIQDGVNGFLVDVGDVEDLAEKLKMLISDDILAKRFGEASRDIVSKEFSSTKHVNYFTKMVQSVL